MQILGIIYHLQILGIIYHIQILGIIYHIQQRDKQIREIPIFRIQGRR